MFFLNYHQRNIAHCIGRCLILTLLTLWLYLESDIFSYPAYTPYSWLLIAGLIYIAISSYSRTNITVMIPLIFIYICDIYILYFLFFSTSYNIIYYFAIFNYSFIKIFLYYIMIIISASFNIILSLHLYYLLYRLNNKEIYNQATLNAEEDMENLYYSVFDFFYPNNMNINTLQQEFERIFLQEKVYINTTLGELLLINIDANAYQDEINKILFLNLIDIQDFYKTIIIPFLAKTIFISGQSLIMINGLTDEQALQYLNAKKITTFNDLSSIQITLYSYEQILKLPYNFILDSDVIRYLINDSIKQYIKKSIQKDIVNVVNISTDDLMLINTPYIYNNTAQIIQQLELLSQKFITKIGDPLSFPEIYKLVHKIFVGYDLKTINDDEKIKSRSQLTINILKEYQKVITPNIREYYLTIVQEMKSGDEDIKVNASDLVINLIMHGYINYKIADKITQRKNKIDELFNLFIVDIKFQSIFNDVITHDAILYSISQNLQIDITQPTLQAKYTAFSSTNPILMQNDLSDKIHEIEQLILAKDFANEKIAAISDNIANNIDLIQSVDLYHSSSKQYKQIYLEQIRTYIKSLLFKLKLNEISTNDLLKNVLGMSLLMPIYIGRNLFKSSVFIDNPDLLSNQKLSKIKIREFILLMLNNNRADNQLYDNYANQMIAEININFSKNRKQLKELMLNCLEYARAIQYTLNQDLNDLNIPVMKKVYGRFYVIDVTNIIVNFTAFISEYSSIQFGFVPLQYDFSKSWIENNQLLDNFLERQLDMANILCLAEVLWHKAFIESKYATNPDLGSRITGFRVKLKELLIQNLPNISIDYINKIISVYHHQYLVLNDMSNPNSSKIPQNGGLIFADILPEKTMFTVDDVLQYTGAFPNVISKYTESQNILKCDFKAGLNNLRASVQKNPMYYFSNKRKFIIYELNNVMVRQIFDFDGAHDINGFANN